MTHILWPTHFDPQIVTHIFWPAHCDPHTITQYGEGAKVEEVDLALNSIFEGKIDYIVWQQIAAITFWANTEPKTYHEPMLGNLLVFFYDRSTLFQSTPRTVLGEKPTEDAQEVIVDDLFNAAKAATKARRQKSGRQPKQNHVTLSLPNVNDNVVPEEEAENTDPAISQTPQDPKRYF